MNNKYRKVLGNSFVFTIGNFGSKILIFLLVPFYTYYLTTSQYGTMDLITTSATLVMPLILFNCYDAVLRFVMDKSYQREQVVSNASFIFGISFCVVFALCIVLGIIDFRKFFNFIMLLVIVIVQGWQSILAQYTRGIGRVKLFAANGILLALILAISNILMLSVFHLGTVGYLSSIIISSGFAGVQLLFANHIANMIDFRLIKKQTIFEMLRYSLPLIPNSIMWWLMNVSSKYIVLAFVGATGNGLLAVASKIPGIVSLFNSIFFQAWQLSAIEEYDSTDKDRFFSKVFETLSAFMFLVVAGLLILLKPIMKIMSSQYYVVWKIVPFLLMSVVYSSFASFLGTNYIAAKKTAAVFSTTIIGGLVSITVNFLTIPFWGINTVGLGNVLSFVVMFFIRLWDTRKFVNLTIVWRTFWLSQIVIGAMIVVNFLCISIPAIMVINCMLMLILMGINMKTLSRTFVVIWGVVLDKLKK